MTPLQSYKKEFDKALYLLLREWQRFSCTNQETQNTTNKENFAILFLNYNRMNCQLHLFANTVYHEWQYFFYIISIKSPFLLQFKQMSKTWIEQLRKGLISGRRRARHVTSLRLILFLNRLVSIRAEDRLKIRMPVKV